MKKNIILQLMIMVWIPFSGLNQTLSNISATRLHYNNPVYSPDGNYILLTDGEYNGVYLYNTLDKSYLQITDAPGSGYVYNWSADSKCIGFKLLLPIGEDEFPLQVPVLFNVEKSVYIRLSAPVKQAGVPSFSENGLVVYSIGHNIHIANSEGILQKTYPVNNYANLTPVSPDGNLVAYNDANDRICLLELQTGKTEIISPDDNVFYNPIWSPDGKKLLYSAFNSQMSVYELSTKTSYALDKGNTPKWSADGTLIYYSQQETIEGYLISKADIYSISYLGGNKNAITQTFDEFEGSVSVNLQRNSYAYVSLKSGELYESNFQGELLPLQLSNENNGVKKWQGKLPYSESEATIKSVKSSSIIEILDVPYIHQVWDTPNDFNGNWACNGAAAMQAIAYYLRLPHRDITVSVPTSHTSHYGYYIARTYTHNNVTYNRSYNDPSGNPATGGYGWYWNGPNTRNQENLRQYIANHDITSSVDWSATWSELQSEIDAKHPVIILNALTSAGHYITATGYFTQQHTIVCNDPFGNKNDGNYGKLHNGKDVRYDWPGYNNGYSNLNTVHCFVYAQSTPPVNAPIVSVPVSNATNVIMPVYINWNDITGYAQTFYRIQIQKGTNAGWNEITGFTDSSTPSLSIPVNENTGSISEYTWGKSSTYAPEPNTTYYITIKFYGGGVTRSKYSQPIKITTGTGQSFAFTYPTSSSNWYCGTHEEITWETTGFSSTDKIRIGWYIGSTYQGLLTPSEGVSNTGSYIVQVPIVDASVNKISITGVVLNSSPVVSDVSDIFSIGKCTDNNSSYLDAEDWTNMYAKSSICLAPGDVDWYKFYVSNQWFYLKVEGNNSTTAGHYGFQWWYDDANDQIGFQTFPAAPYQQDVDTKITLYHSSSLTYLSNDDNSGTGSFSEIIFSIADKTISGYLRDAANNAIGGVTMSGLPGSPQTNASGYYSATVTYGWSGTVTPSKTGYEFSPVSKTYNNVIGNQSLDYTGKNTTTYTISGYVRDASNNAISGVTMNGLPGSPQTNTSGYYSASITYGWSGTVTPSKMGYEFSPVSKVYSNIISNQSLNYTGTNISTYTISGYVRDAANNAINDVAMNGLPGSPKTNTSGYYSATVSYGWSGTVTPSKSGYEFSPVSKVYSNIISNQSLNYTGTPLNNIVHFTGFATQGLTYTIAIQQIVLEITGVSLQVGDEIGFYCEDAGLVGAVKYNGTFPLSGVAYLTDNVGGIQVPGATIGNPIIFKVWLASENKEYDATPTFLSGGTFGLGVGTNVGQLTINDEHTFTYTLNANSIGIISLPVQSNLQVPSILGVSNIFALLSDYGSYIPSWGVNTLSISEKIGIKAFNTSQLELSVTGSPLTGGQTISLPANSIRMVGFPYSSSHTALELFANYPEITFAADDKGNVYIPEWGLTSATFQPFGGLKIYCNSSINYTYPVLVNSGLKHESSGYYNVGSSFTFNQSGDVYILIIDKTKGLQYGDELAVFDGDKCVGSVIFEGQQPIYIKTWLGDNLLGVDGAAEGNTIEVMVKKANSNEVIPSNIEFQVGGTFGEGAYSVANLTVGSTTNMYNLIVENAQLNVFPNPSNGTVTFTYKIPNNAKTARIEVVDLSGRTIKSFAIDNYIKENALQWTTDNLLGTYLCKLIVDEQVIATKKLVFTE